MKSINIVFGNHNTPNAVEDYLYFIDKSAKYISKNTFISHEVITSSDVVIIQEAFSERDVIGLTKFKKITQAKKLVIIATENMSGDSFNDTNSLCQIMDKSPHLREMAQVHLKSLNVPVFLFKKYFSKIRRDIKGFESTLKLIEKDQIEILRRRYTNFLKVANYADQIWVMPGLKSEPYYKMFGEKVHPFPFILVATSSRINEAIQHCALLSGKISPHRRNLLNYLQLDEPYNGGPQNSWQNQVITSGFDVPLSIRREMLRTTGVYMDLPVSDGSQIFSSMKSAIALESGAPFFALTGADPGKFALFVRTFADIRNLKEALQGYSKSEFVEMGAQLSSDAAKVFTPAAYPFLEELLK